MMSIDVNRVECENEIDKWHKKIEYEVYLIKIFKNLKKNLNWAFENF